MSDEEIQSVAKQAEAHYDWLKDQVHLQYDEIQGLKERIDKAIEYIEELGTQDGILKYYRIDKYIKEDLLDILRGGKE